MTWLISAAIYGVALTIVYVLAYRAGYRDGDRDGWTRGFTQTNKIHDEARRTARWWRDGESDYRPPSASDRVG